MLSRWVMVTVFLGGRTLIVSVLTLKNTIPFTTQKHHSQTAAQSTSRNRRVRESLYMKFYKGN